MFKKHNVRQLFALILNAILLLLEILGFYLIICDHNKLLIKYYTQSSNLLTLITSFLFVISYFVNLSNEHNKIPNWVKKLRYVSTCSLALTLFMVLLYSLSLSNGTFTNAMLHNSSLYHHTLCPIISIISFILFEEYNKQGIKDIVTALSFTFIYGFIILIVNILKILKGPYTFLLIYNQPIYSTILYVVSILLCAIIIAKLLIASNISISKLWDKYHNKSKKIDTQKKPYK